MKDRFFRLSNGKLINMYAVMTAEPTTMEGKVTELAVIIHGHEHRVSGDDAAALYQALTTDDAPDVTAA